MFPSASAGVKGRPRIGCPQVEITGFKFQSPRTMRAELRSQGLLVLLGRDLLMHCLLVYNGLTGQIILFL